MFLARNALSWRAWMIKVDPLGSLRECHTPTLSAAAEYRRSPGKGRRDVISAVGRGYQRRAYARRVRRLQVVMDHGLEFEDPRFRSQASSPPRRLN